MFEVSLDRFSDEGKDTAGCRHVSTTVRIVSTNRLPRACACAWKLSLWLIEMVLVEALRTRWSYANRLAGHRWVGQVERVPSVALEDETA